jgi:PAS domain S-box-containing protein
MTTIQMIENEKYLEKNQDLILTLNLHEEIIQFNKESERFTGYLRDEILYKKFDEFLVPPQSMEQWNEIFNSIRKTMWIDNFLLPLQTKNKQTFMIAWSGFLVKDENGAIKNICIFGKPLKFEKKSRESTGLSSESFIKPPTSLSRPDSQRNDPESTSKKLPPESTDLPPIPTIKPKEPEIKSDSVSKAFMEVSQEMPKNPIKTSSSQENLFSESEKKSLCKETTGPEIQEKTTKQTSNTSFNPFENRHKLEKKQVAASVVQPVVEKNIQKNQAEAAKYHGIKKMRFASKKTIEPSLVNMSFQEKYLKPLATMEARLETTSTKIDSLQETIQDITQQYEMIADRVAELEKKDRRWQKKHSMKNRSAPSLEEDIKHSFDELKETTATPKQSEDPQPSENEPGSFFSDPFGIKRQQKEVSSKQQQLEVRSKKLEDSEAQLLKERSIFNARVEEFSRWREKLMHLESAIEKRRQELMKQEKNETSQHPIISQIKNPARVNLEKNDEFSPYSSEETLNKIPQSAAILQRGVLKQINSPFEEMLGYPKEELVEKSFFDFIALEGLGEIEKYYLDRLKGDNATMYTTVFSTKDNRKIPVEVSIKQTVYNGEKAEIIILTCVQK